MFNLPLVPRPFTRAASEGEDYDMTYIAKRLAEVMDDVSASKLGRCVWRVVIVLTCDGRVWMRLFFFPRRAF